MNLKLIITKLLSTEYMTQVIFIFSNFKVQYVIFLIEFKFEFLFVELITLKSDREK